MLEEPLLEHIRTTLKQGVSRSELKDLLLKSGWPSKLGEEYLQKTFKELSPDVLLRAFNLTKSFGREAILDNVNLDIKPGEIFGLVGVSGAGKTTLLNLLVGFLNPDAGDVVLAMPNKSVVSVFKNPEAVKKMIGFSTQTPSFYPKLTVRENLEHFASRYGIDEPERTRRCNALLELVGLKGAKEIAAANLSGGMQKRLDIACAMLHDPAILILDEPTADLDPLLRKQMWELIRQINAKGTTVLLASHFLAEIELLCSRIALLHNKHILHIGTSDELRDIYSRNYQIYIQTAGENYKEMLKEIEKSKKLFVRAYEKDGELVIETPNPEKLLPAISAHVTRHSLKIRLLQVSKPALGEVFEAFVSK